MVMSAPGHVSYSSYNTLYGDFFSGCRPVTVTFLRFLTIPPLPDAIEGARSPVRRCFNRQAKAYKEANPQMCVRIIAFKRTRVMYTYNSRCYPWEDKKQ